MRRMFVWGLAMVCTGGPAWGETCQGTLDRLEVYANQPRFVARDAGLTLFATGIYQDVLLRAYFAKSSVVLNYQIQPCGGGTAGKCGTVQGIRIEPQAGQGRTGLSCE